MTLDFQKLFLVALVNITANVGFSQNWDKFSVPLGEKNWNDKVEEKPNNCTAVTIRVDGEGNYYPNIFIEDKSMKKADGKLELWYEKNPEKYNAILESHNILKNEESLSRLNKAIEENFVKMIDAQSVDKDIIFLIHGYRKQMYNQKDNALSMRENDAAERYLGNNKLFVEIYWNSHHITFVRGIIEKRILKMMAARATPNAKRVGTQLRSLVSSLQKSNVTILSHSLGSVIANELSFNYKPDEKFMDGKELNMIYLAPAIGHESFKNADRRGSGNFKLNTIIAYNNNDFVLRKDFSQFGITIDSNAKTYGNTSLGCNHEDDLEKLMSLYENQLQSEDKPVLIDMSGRINHNFTYYVTHPSFSKVLNLIEEDRFN